MLIGRQVDQFTTTIHPAFSRCIGNLHRLRIDGQRYAGAVAVNNLLQIGGQRVVPFLADLGDDEDSGATVSFTLLTLHSFGSPDFVSPFASSLILDQLQRRRSVREGMLDFNASTCRRDQRPKTFELGAPDYFHIAVTRHIARGLGVAERHRPNPEADRISSHHRAPHRTPG